MSVKITGVEKHSLADKKRIHSGDTLLAINGHDINDVLDYSFYLCDEKTTLTVLTSSGKEKHVHLHKKSDEDIGLEFETYLMDKQRACKNKCIFCFIDQLPKGLRKSLYFKDDDSRLSFLFGNYITMTNLSPEEVDRIINMHISPVNISVHTMNPELRVSMMKNPAAATSLEYIPKFAAAGIKINAQLVLCPGINDGKELEYSLRELSKYYPSVQSIAAVPVGLTMHREGLPEIKQFTAEGASAVIDTIDRFNENFASENGETIAYAADEFFIEAGRGIPEEDYYGEYPQLENGVGLWSLLRSEFMRALEDVDTPMPDLKTTCITGTAAFPLISSLAEMVNEKLGCSVNVVEAKNRLFGESVTVAGLLGGEDIAFAANSAENCAEKIIIPAAALRREGDIFLDDMTLDELASRTGKKVFPVENDGYRLLEEMISG